MIPHPNLRQQPERRPGRPEPRAAAHAGRISVSCEGDTCKVVTSVVASLVTGSALLWGDVILMPIPVPLVGGLLVFIGLVLLDDWLRRSLGVLPWTEYAIVLLMFVTIVGFGFLESSMVRVMRSRREVRSGRMQPRSRTNRAG